MPRAKKKPSPISDSIKVEEVRVALTGEPSAMLLGNLIDEEGDTNGFDYTFAREFARLAQCPESDVLMQVRGLEQATDSFTGRNGQGRRVQYACERILDWWLTAGEHNTTNLLSFLACRQSQAVWAVLLKQVGYGPVKIERI